MIDVRLRPMDGDDEATRATIAKMQPVMIAQNDQLWEHLDENFAALIVLLEGIKIQYANNSSVAEKAIHACVTAVVSELAIRRNVRLLAGEKQ